MNLLSPVSEIMTTNLHTLKPSASIAEAAELFEKHKIHHIPIVIDEKLVGIISMSDYLFFRRGFLDNHEDEKLEQIRMNNYEVSYIMTKGLATLEPTTRVNVALEVFKENILHAIPVIDEDKLVGIVTTHDIITLLAADNEAHAKY